jgi:hypothetical protein
MSVKKSGPDFGLLKPLHIPQSMMKVQNRQFGGLDLELFAYAC